MEENSSSGKIDDDASDVVEIIDRKEEHNAEISDTTNETVLKESTNVSSSPCLIDVEEMVTKMTEDFLAEVHPQLIEMREQAEEISKNQGVLIDTMALENKKFAENEDIQELIKMLPVVQSYYTKLKKIKSDMDNLDERLGKLKKRSLKLKERRHKKDNEEAERKQQEMVLEQELTAKKKVK